MTYDTGAHTSFIFVFTCFQQLLKLKMLLFREIRVIVMTKISALYYILDNRNIRHTVSTHDDNDIYLNIARM
jgi:hypothetical protein